MKFNIHDKDESKRVRFALGFYGRPQIFVLGINPSTANKEKSDTTITKVAAFSKKIGSQGFVMLNIYPQRATNPDELHAKSDCDLFNRNIEIIRSHVLSEKSPQIWAAWGNLICQRDYLWDSLSEIAHSLKEFKPVWQYCGQPTKKVIHVILRGLLTRKNFPNSIFLSI